MSRNQGRLLLAFGLVLGSMPSIHGQDSEQLIARKAIPTSRLAIRDNDVTAIKPKAAPVSIHHWDQTWNGWSVSESTHFRIFHQDSPRLAEKVARIAEETRDTVQQKWFGKNSPWNSRCEIFLYPSAEDYSWATGAAPVSPGHSSFRVDHGRVYYRRIDLRCDDSRLLRAVLPHETTHTVLAGMFGDQQVPRWVDEGIAVLSEPPDMIRRHLVSLPQWQRNGMLFSSREIMEAHDYPDPRGVAMFYAQSVSLVQFLSQRDPQQFVRFVRYGLQQGFEKALTDYYNWDYDQLEDHWEQFALVPMPNPDTAHAGLSTTH
ncbi:MAG TPA: hypothetical protein VFA18_00675 [Gemmataceae bacterium]|nr:hypothetical protein [Gemmataceae bacterium]